MYATIMQFGKYKGTIIGLVPTSYLKWATANCTGIDPWMMRAMQDELETRANNGAKPEPQPAPPGRNMVDFASVVKTWYREMSMRFHPDRGGDVKQMQAIGVAHDRLRELAGVK